jgi:autoinducer 2-degrading protein
MLVQVVYLEVSPDKMDAFLAEATANVHASRQEPGVERFDLLQQADSSHKFMLYEVYTGPEALEAHRGTPHFKHWVEFGVPLLVGERVRVMYTLVA